MSPGEPPMLPRLLEEVVKGHWAGHVPWMVPNNPVMHIFSENLKEGGKWDDQGPERLDCVEGDLEE